MSESLVFCERKSEWAIPSKKRAICSFAHLSLATWANRSQSFICHKRPERFAHSCSFVVSDLSKLLTVANLIWVNERWGNERIPNPASKPLKFKKVLLCYLLLINCYSTVGWSDFWRHKIGHVSCCTKLQYYVTPIPKFQFEMLLQRAMRPYSKYNSREYSPATYS